MTAVVDALNIHVYHFRREPLNQKLILTLSTFCEDKNVEIEVAFLSLYVTCMHQDVRCPSDTYACRHRWCLFSRHSICSNMSSKSGKRRPYIVQSNSSVKSSLGQTN